MKIGDTVFVKGKVYVNRTPTELTHTGVFMGIDASTSEAFIQFPWHNKFIGEVSRVKLSKVEVME
jgi:hypothetical protein